MNIENFIAGQLQKGYEYSYFLPNTINLIWNISDSRIQRRLEFVSIKLGELNSFAKFVPNIDLFIQSYVMKEAVTSSRIEGTKTNMEDAYTEEENIEPEFKNDWNETIQYREALNYAVNELKNLPISNRLFKEVHQILLSQVRGEHKSPGEFRRSQNWIGGARLKDAVFVPPSAEHIAELMSDLEKFLHNEESSVPYLIKIAMAHYQFETIHPFLDGNGRTGRLMIPLYLVSAGILESPLLYISDFFEKHKGLYYEKLTLVRENNDLIGWILFFLEAIESTAISAVTSLRDILALKESITIEKISKLGRKVPSAQKFLDVLFQKPVVTAHIVAQKVGLTPKAANDLIADFVRLEILKETTGNKRNRSFSFKQYLEILSR